jgi:hypothetical protein
MAAQNKEKRMNITARRREGAGGLKFGEEAYLQVRSNPFRLLGMGQALYVWRRWNDDKFSFNTISGFLRVWDVTSSNAHRIRLPWLKEEHGLGEVAANFFALFGVYPKKDCGCPDRKEWWDWLLVFTPWRDR